MLCGTPILYKIQFVIKLLNFFCSLKYLKIILKTVNNNVYIYSIYLYIVGILCGCIQYNIIINIQHLNLLY